MNILFLFFLRFPSPCTRLHMHFILLHLQRSLHSIHFRISISLFYLNSLCVYLGQLNPNTIRSLLLSFYFFFTLANSDIEMNFISFYLLFSSPSSIFFRQFNDVGTQLQNRKLSDENCLFCMKKVCFTVSHRQSPSTTKNLNLKLSPDDGMRYHHTFALSYVYVRLRTC